MSNADRLTDEVEIPSVRSLIGANRSDKTIVEARKKRSGYLYDTCLQCLLYESRKVKLPTCLPFSSVDFIISLFCFCLFRQVPKQAFDCTWMK